MSGDVARCPRLLTNPGYNDRPSELLYDTFQDWRTILIPKGSKLKLMPSYLFFISIALDTFKMTWKMIPYAKYWLEVHFSPIVRHFFKNNYFLQLFLNFRFLIIWNKKKYYVLKIYFIILSFWLFFAFFYVTAKNQLWLISLWNFYYIK